MFAFGVNVTSYPLFSTVGTSSGFFHAKLPNSIVLGVKLDSANFCPYSNPLATGYVISGAAALFIETD